MLFIGDIHIHPRYGTLTLDTIRDYITQHDSDQDIVFLGDYVYHFSYHRPSLLALLDLFIELSNNGKQVYVLAGNHDRLGQHFVYSETEKILSITQNNNLHIITKPEYFSIQGKDFLFLPYMLSRQRYTPAQEHYHERSLDLQSLIHSEKSNDQESYLLNAYLEDESKKHKDLTVIHHYYIAGTTFPSIKSQFGYQDKAISPHFLDYKNIKLISGHIHHSFAYKNYMCLGSVRSTSPLESNTFQRLTQYNIQDNTWTLTQVAINPYLIIQPNSDTLVTNETLHSFRDDLTKKSEQSFQSDQFSLSFNYCALPLSRTTVTLSSNQLSYENIDEHIDPTLRGQIRDIQLKQTPITMDKAIQDLVDSSADFGSSWSNWKQLLHDYLESKYGDKKEDYLTLLNDLDIKV